MRIGENGLTRDQLRSKQWRRSSRGLYVPADAPLTVSQRIVEGAASLPRDAVAAGWAAAYWRGVRFLDGRGPTGRPLPSHHYVPPQCRVRPSPSVRISRERLSDDDVDEFCGLRVTTPIRTCFDGARLAGTLVEAVVFVDMMLASGLVSLPELSTYVDGHGPGWRGVRQARRALALADAASRSPMETRLRMNWVLIAKLPHPLVNAAVYADNGALLGLPDLLGVAAATVGEYDGADHQDLDGYTADNRREEMLEAHGLLVVRVTSLDMRRPAELATRLRAAHARGLGRDRRRDRWTLEPPW